PVLHGPSTKTATHADSIRRASHTTRLGAEKRRSSSVRRSATSTPSTLKAALRVATILSGTIDGSQVISSTRSPPGSLDESRPLAHLQEMRTVSSTPATMMYNRL